MSNSKDPVWLRCQETIRKLLWATGRDALVYAQSALVLQRTFASDSQVARGSGSRTFFPPMGSFRAPSTLSTVTEPA